jgi:hypothetical protein
MSSFQLDAIWGGTHTKITDSRSYLGSTFYRYSPRNGHSVNQELI